MAKKKTTKKATKKRVNWKKKADDLWSLIIRTHYGRCEICDKKAFKTKAGLKVGGMNAHHVISRTNLLWRYDLLNGMCLCIRCHLYRADCSPHARSITGITAFIDWMQDDKPKQWAWYEEHKLIKMTPDLTYEESYIFLKDIQNKGEFPAYDE